MPRNTGVSGRSTIRFIFFSPSERTILLCFSGVQMTLRTSLIFIVPGILGALFDWRFEAAEVRNLVLVAKLFERIDCCLHNVVRVVRAERFGENVRDSDGLT